MNSCGARSRLAPSRHPGGRALESKWADSLDSIGQGFAFAGLGGGAALLSWQIYTWLKTGEWPPISTPDGLFIAWAFLFADGSAAPHFVQWLIAPETWIGVHKILDAIPAALTLFLVGIGGLMLFVDLAATHREKQKAVQNEAQPP